MREEIIHGDCLEVMRRMADSSVDAVVTDPPYGINGGKGGDARDFQKGAYSGEWSDTEEYIASLVIPVIQECFRVSRGAVVVTPGIRCLHLYPRARDIGCFWTPAAATHGPWGFSTFQPILYYGKDWRAGKGAWPSGKQVTERAAKNGHPCPKPVGAWQWLIEKAAPPGALVLDPFFGSGTTGEACMKSGRGFIGIEREADYVEIARRRLADVQPDLEPAA